MRAPVVVLALLLAGCNAIPRVVAQKEAQECVVPLAAVEPVAIPARLTPGATNEDLRNREQQLEGLLEKANQRLAEVPGLVNSKPASEAPAPGLLDRLKGWFK